MKVFCTVTRVNANVGHFVADLIFIDGHPFAVFEWSGSRTQEECSPLVKAELEVNRLHAVQGWGEVTHVYEVPTEDPRKLQ